MIALKLLDESPADVVVIGVQPLSTEWSAELTVPVREVLPALVEAVMEQLDVWKAGPQVAAGFLWTSHSHRREFGIQPLDGGIKHSQRRSSGQGWELL